MEVPDEDVVAGLVPVVFDPIGELFGTFAFFGVCFGFDECGGCPDDETSVGELVHFFFKCVVLKFVVGESFGIACYVGGVGVGLDM